MPKLIFDIGLPGHLACLKNDAGIKTNADLLNNALTFLHASIEASKRGEFIASIDASGKIINIQNMRCLRVAQAIAKA